MSPDSDRGWAAFAAWAWFLSRAAFFLVALLSVLVLPDGGNGPTAFSQARGALKDNGCSGNFFCRFVSWDALWYVDVATHGYSFNESRQSNVNFFPLYPALVSVGAAATGNVWLSAFLISNLALVGALYFFYRLARMDYDAPSARRALVYLLVFPASFFLSIPYTESLFLLLSVAAFYFARKQDWAMAAAAGFLAGMTRPVGIILVVPLAMEYLSSRRAGPWLAFALAPAAGMAAYFAFLWAKLGEPLAWLRMQHFFSRGFFTENPSNYFLGTIVWPWVLLTPRYAEEWLSLAFWVIGFAVLALALFRRVRAPYAAYLLLTFAAMFTGGLITSAHRYLMMAFPLFFILGAEGKNEVVDRAVLLVLSALLALTIILFANNYWGVF